MAADQQQQQSKRVKQRQTERERGYDEGIKWI